MSRLDDARLSAHLVRRSGAPATEADRTRAEHLAAEVGRRITAERQAAPWRLRWAARIRGDALVGAAVAVVVVAMVALSGLLLPQPGASPGTDGVTGVRALSTGELVDLVARPWLPGVVGRVVVVDADVEEELWRCRAGGPPCPVGRIAGTQVLVYAEDLLLAGKNLRTSGPLAVRVRELNAVDLVGHVRTAADGGLAWRVPDLLDELERLEGATKLAPALYAVDGWLSEMAIPPGCPSTLDESGQIRGDGRFECGGAAWLAADARQPNVITISSDSTSYSIEIPAPGLRVQNGAYGTFAKEPAFSAATGPTPRRAVYLVRPEFTRPDGCWMCTDQLAEIVARLEPVESPPLTTLPPTTSPTEPPVTPATPTEPPEATGRWERLPDPPLSARRSAHAFWVGSKFIVMGGTTAPPCPPGADCGPPDEPPLSDGAAYDPELRAWRRIADAPVPLGIESGVVLGDTVYVWLIGSVEPELRSAFLAYDADDDSWRTLPVPSSAPPVGYRLAAIPEGVVAYLTTEERGPSPDQLWDIGSGRWREVPTDPLSPSFDRTMVWTGDELVLVAIELVPSPGSERPSVYRAASLDPTTGQWRRLADSEIVLWDPTWYWAAGMLVNPSLGSSDGGAVGNWGRSYSHGGMLDPESGVWSHLPATPGGGATYEGISAGGPAFVVSRQGWVLDVSRSMWRPLIRPDGTPDTGMAAAWVGDRLIIFGGSQWQGDTSDLFSAAWEWLPPLADP